MPSVTLFENDPNVMSVSKGHRFFGVGDPGDAMYVVIDGEVELELRGEALESVGHGGFFGEMALLDHKPRSACATAKTDCRVVQVDQRRFLYLIQNTPFFAIEVMTVMSDRLRHADDLINRQG
jgi:CRP/FNR family transcriptional regulator, cyclic AMP receptor protein